MKKSAKQFNIFSVLFLICFLSTDLLAKDLTNYNELKIGVSILPQTLDPMKIVSVSHLMMSACVFSRLVRLNERGIVVSELAESWSINDSGREYTFKLKPNLRFHNGRKITAKDVEHSFLRILESNFSSRSILELALQPKTKAGTNAVEAIDEQHIRFYLKGPYPPFLKLLNNPLFGIVEKESFCCTGSGLMTASLTNKGKTWSFEPRTSSENIYKLVVEGYDYSDLRTLIEANKFDVFLGVAPYELAKIKLDSSSFDVVLPNNVFVLHFLYNTHRAHLKSSNLRRDLSYLISSLSTIKKNLVPFQKSLHTFLPEGTLPMSYYGPRKSQITEDNFVTKYPKLEGHKFRVVVYKGFMSQQHINSVSSLLERLGLVPDIRIVDLALLLNYYKTGDFDLISFIFGAGLTDPDGYLWPLQSKLFGVERLFPVKEFLDRISAIRFTKKRLRRLKLYERELVDFESRHFFVPILAFDYPILLKKQIDMPKFGETFFHELWKLHRKGLGGNA